MWTQAKWLQWIYSNQSFNGTQLSSFLSFPLSHIFKTANNKKNIETNTKLHLKYVYAALPVNRKNHRHYGSHNSNSNNHSEQITTATATTTTLHTAASSSGNIQQQKQQLQQLLLLHLQPIHRICCRAGFTTGR